MIRILIILVSFKQREQQRFSRTPIADYVRPRATGNQNKHIIESGKTLGEEEILQPKEVP